MIGIDELMGRLDAQGIRIVWRNLGRVRGRYVDVHRLIVMNTRLSGPQALSTLAHEAGHAHYRDTTTTPAVEARATEHGARLLITPRAYASAEQAAGRHPGAIARELGVTRELIEAWGRAAPRPLMLCRALG